MATEIQVITLCDPCQKQGHRTVDAENVTISLAGMSQPRVIALCEVHSKEFYQPLADLLEELGQPLPSGSSSPPRKVVPEGDRLRCPECDGSFQSRGSLQGHTRTQHGKTLAELEGAPVPYVCEAPNCDAKFPLPQNLAVHKSRAHGIKGKST